MVVSEFLDFSFVKAIVIFFVYVIVDLLYAYYILCVGRQQAFRAATASSILYSLLAYGVISYSENKYYLIPLGMGAWVGTFILVTWDKRKQRDEQ